MVKIHYFYFFQSFFKALLFTAFQVPNAKNLSIVYCSNLDAYTMLAFLHLLKVYYPCKTSCPYDIKYPRVLTLQPLHSPTC